MQLDLYNSNGIAKAFEAWHSVSVVTYEKYFNCSTELEVRKDVWRIAFKEIGANRSKQTFEKYVE